MFTSTDTVERRPALVVDAVQSLADRAGGKVSGVPAFRAGVNSGMRAELIRFVPLVVVLVSLVLLFALRDWVGVAIALAAGGVASICMLGLMALTGTPLTLSTMVLPCALLAFGCAYSMHPIVAASGASSTEGLVDGIAGCLHVQ